MEPATSIPVALQMYTLREQAAEDFAGTLRQVAEMGHAGVEFAGYGGLSAVRMKALLEELGLKPAGSHISLGLLETELGSAIDYSLGIGNPYVVCPWLAQDRWQDAAALHTTAESLNRIGAACRQQGLQLCYHNHAFEFESIGDRRILDILYGETDPELVRAEVDTYWVQFAGLDPVELIGRWSERVTLVHLKDMDPEDRAFAEVGEGTLDWMAIFAASEEVGAEWYTVEQDRCKRHPLESARLSLDNLRGMGAA
jgi:sugar phosphate isomerase/epimerase